MHTVVVKLIAGATSMAQVVKAWADEILNRGRGIFMVAGKTLKLIK
ncbi:MAG: hypothetical protein H3C25_03115 [Candidatus Brocadia sapporoensis]|nr:hypothetical protein [Candidatus Brocadia sapporoensis]